MTSPKLTRARAFTLVEILVVLVIVGILLAMAMVLTRGISAAQKRSLTASRIAAVDAALTQFVVQNRRLPCPADGSIATGGVNAGLSAGGDTVACTGAQLNGVVPWVSLGIAEADATDGWDRRLTYRVAPPLALSSRMDMSQCDPAGTGPAAGIAPDTTCAPACLSTNLAACTAPAAFLLNKGLPIQSMVGAVQMDPATGTGAAYVVISAGETGGGAFLNSGQLSTTTTTDGTGEQNNYANLTLRAFYVDDSATDVAGANHFDDMMSRPSVLSVVTKASLGPRSH